MEESRSQPLELGLENCYDSSKRKSTAERTIETDLRHSALVVRRPFLPYSYFYTRQSYSSILNFKNEATGKTPNILISPQGQDV